MSEVGKAENVEISAYWVVVTSPRQHARARAKWRICAQCDVTFISFVWFLSVHFKTRYIRLRLKFWHEIKNIRFGVKSRKESSNKWKPMLKWRRNNYVIVTSTKCFVITGTLLANSRLFGSSLRFDSLELRSEGLRPIKVTKAWYIEGCSYRNNNTVSLVRKFYEIFHPHGGFGWTLIMKYWLLSLRIFTLITRKLVNAYYWICESFDILSGWTISSIKVKVTLSRWQGSNA